MPYSRSVLGPTRQLTGPAAHLAARRFRWVWAAVAVEAVVVLAGWLVWRRSLEQMTFLSMGVTALIGAGMVAKDGVIGVFTSTIGGKETVTLEESPLPRQVLAPALALVGLGLIVAATSTRLGSVLSGVARVTLVIWHFGEAAWTVLLMLAISVGALVMLRSRRDRAAGFVWLGILAVGVLINYGMYRLAPDTFHSSWDSFFAPFREVWRLLGH